MYEYRPRPALWRLAIVVAAQLFIAGWIASLASSVVELTILRRAGLRSWFVYATPWDGVRERLAVRTTPRIDDDPYSIAFADPPVAEDRHLAGRAVRADAEHMHRGGWFAVGATALAMLVLYLWPGGPSLASRMFGYVLAAVLATFAAPRLAFYEMQYPLDLWYELPPAAMAGSLSTLVALGVAIAAIRRLLTLLGNVFEVRRLPVRLGLVSFLILPAAAIAAASLFATHTHVGAACALLLAGAAFVGALPPVPSRFEQLTRIDLRTAVVPLVVAALLLGATAVRVVTLRDGRVRLETWASIRAGIHRHWPVSRIPHAPPHHSHDPAAHR